MRPFEGQGGADEWKVPEESKQEHLTWGLQKRSFVKEGMGGRKE